ncbi:MAG: Ig-like domain-containing protein [Paludibacter sp.]|nr:Ig-like domain-containing protein [Paludibacter sp.]
MKKIKLLSTLAILAVVLFAGCKSDDYVAIDGGPCPAVVSVTPASGATLVGRKAVSAAELAIRTTIVTAKFNKKMNPETINETSFTVTGTSAAVAGTVTYSDADSTATFTASSKFADNTTFTARVTTAVKDVMGNTLQADYVWVFSTGTTILPVVIATSPLNLATNVVLNQTITATFSVPMDQATITGTTFTLKNGTTPVLGLVSGTGNSVSFTPTLGLSPTTVYTAQITMAAKNLDGSSIAKDTTWTFTTGEVAPTVLSTNPVNLTANVPLNKTVSVSFSKAMDPTTITAATFTVRVGTTNIVGTLNYSGTTASFNPTTDFLPNTTYVATITTGAKTGTGAALASDYSWTFSTGDFTPAVIFTDPANLDANVAVDKAIAATFSVTMNPLTISNATFTVKAGATNVLGNVSYLGNIATFTPNSNLIAGTTYTATITTGAKSASNKALASDYVWTFSVPLIASAPSFVNLRSVARFAIISGVGVSNNAGASVVNNMDVGIYPGARSSVTGFPPATIVNGNIYAADDGAATAAMLNQAKLDLVVAYLFAESCIAMPPQTVAGNQGGKTLAPGIYKSTSTLSVDGSDLTLDAQGDPNAYWIFQVASTLTTTTGGNIKLTGGAQAKNVFWQTGSSATIGTYTTFNGSILALQSITMDSYAVMTGRMLARNGAVVMTSTNTINKP